MCTARLRESVSEKPVSAGCTEVLAVIQRGAALERKSLSVILAECDHWMSSQNITKASGEPNRLRGRVKALKIVLYRVKTPRLGITHPGPLFR